MQNCMTWASVCPETVEQKPCMMREIETWLSVGSSYNRVVDQSSLHCVVVLTAMSDRSGRQDASHGGGCSKMSACTCQFGWILMI